MRHKQVQESPRPLILAAVGENGEFIAAASALLSGSFDYVEVRYVKVDLVGS